MFCIFDCFSSSKLSWVLIITGFHHHPSHNHPTSVHSFVIFFSGSSKSTSWGWVQMGMGSDGYFLHLQCSFAPFALWQGFGRFGFELPTEAAVASSNMSQMVRRLCRNMQQFFITSSFKLFQFHNFTCACGCYTSRPKALEICYFEKLAKGFLAFLDFKTQGEILELLFKNSLRAEGAYFHRPRCELDFSEFQRHCVCQEWVPWRETRWLKMSQKQLQKKAG